jgi:hypothetical protein
VEDDPKKKMEELLKAYEKKQEGPKPMKGQDEAAVKAFRQEFRQLCEGVVRPTLNGLSDMFRRHGHDCEVKEQTATEAATGNELVLQLRMTIVPAGVRRSAFGDAEPPYLCVMPEEGAKRVRVLAGTAMPGKPRRPTVNHYTIAEVSGEVVEREVLAVLQAILGEE